MSKFEEMITTHKQMIKSDINLICEHLSKRGDEHDNDKIKPGYINDVYTKHFPELKKIEFGTSEYKAYEQKYFKEAHKLHAQNRHHYYNPLNTLVDISLFDLLEAIVDVKQSQSQYSTYDVNLIMKTLESKGALDLNLEQLVKNTILKIEELNEHKI